jgi:hypothetical protein
MTRITLREIREFTPKDRPTIIVTTDGYVDRWFVNWRIGRYYLPRQDFWILYNNPASKHVDHIRRDQVLEVRAAPVTAEVHDGKRGVPIDSPLELPIFSEGRILWLIEPGSAFHKEVAAVQKLGGGQYVFYSDITPESPPFVVEGLKIVPTSLTNGLQ